MRWARNKSSRVKEGEGGFTIVEFLIATAVFSVVMLLCAYAIVHVGRMYYKGMITNRTQDAARRVIDDVAAVVQFGAGDVASGSNDDRLAWCMGNTRYTYILNDPLGSVPHVLWKDTHSSGGCDPADISEAEPEDSIDGQEMLGSNMRITRFDMPPATADGLQTISIRIAYGDSNDLFEGNNPNQPCKGTNAGGQFCAVSEFTTHVKRRLP